MAGIGEQDAAGRLVSVQAELPNDIDGILDAIRKVILMGGVQSLTLKVGEPITYQRLVVDGEEIRPEESTQSYAELSAYDIIRNIQMVEWEPGPEEVGSPRTTLVWMFMEMAVRGWAVTHLLLGENTQFWEWLGVTARVGQSIDQFLGARLETCKELPSGVFILCGAKTRQATIAEVDFALKGTAHGQSIDAEGD